MLQVLLQPLQKQPVLAAEVWFKNKNLQNKITLKSNGRWTTELSVSFEVEVEQRIDLQCIFFG